MQFANLFSLFRERVNQHRERNAFYVRQHGRWVGISWDRFEREAYEFGYALLAMGLEKGSSVCILMNNVPAWPVSDLGTIMAGGVSVGLYPTSSPDQCQYIINHSDAEFVLVDTPAQLDKVWLVRDRLPKLKTVIALDDSAAQEREGVLSYSNFLRLGRKHQERASVSLQERASEAQPEDIAMMVYTSGTTGLPKGACLSHRYVINSVESLLGTIPLRESDRTFSYLPFCHVAERISGLYTRIYAGAPAFFVDDLTRFWDYMIEVKPTIFGSLPRFFEKIYARIMANLDQASPNERQRFLQALSTGQAMARRRHARRRIPKEEMNAYEQQQVLPLLSRVKACFGGEIRLATSGGAPLPLEIAKFFDAAGLPILEAYGLTENLCVAFNRPGNYKVGTVGPPMPGCDVSIAEDGEILVRSEMMFSGYYKNPQQTAETFRDGWLLTGDLGELDEDGFLKITGRKKELIITSTGKNISPMLIENNLKDHPLISQAMAYGDGKSYLVALLTLNQMETEAYARARGIACRDFAELSQRPEIVSLVQKIVNDANAKVSSTESIKKFAILDHDLSLEADELTPTMKVRRSVVMNRYKHLLESLYNNPSGELARNQPDPLRP